MHVYSISLLQTLEFVAGYEVFSEEKNPGIDIPGSPGRDISFLSFVPFVSFVVQILRPRSANGYCRPT